MKNKDVLAVIYNVGELKAAFDAVRQERLKVMQAEPLPKGLKSLSAPCLSQDLTVQAVKSLELLKAHFKDTDYIGLTAVPCELTTSADASSKPFHAHYVENNWRLIGAEEIEHFSEIIRAPR